jgi:hypothetical protein
MNNQVVVQKTELTEKFLIKPNKKFDILPSQGITELENTPVSVSYQTISHPTNGGQTVSFQTRIGETFFLDRGVILQQEIPVAITLATAHASTIDASNYVEACGYFKNLALRQNGLIAGIENIELTLNENVVTNVTQVARAYEMSSEYYAGGDMAKFMPASQPDRFYSYDHYEGTGPKVVSSKNELGNTVQLAITPVNEENIFTGGYSNTYNSRKIVAQFVSATSDNKTVNVKLFLWCYIPYCSLRINLLSSDDST